MRDVIIACDFKNQEELFDFLNYMESYLMKGIV